MSLIAPFIVEPSRPRPHQHEHRGPHRRGPRGILALEDGTWFEGTAIGATGEAAGEVVFTTSATGYQEVLTDPSYAGQIVTFTSPHVGNYGANPGDMESRRAFCRGVVVRELSRLASNWQASSTLADFLVSQGLVGLEGVDTRSLTLHIRERGAMRGVLSHVDLDPDSLVAKARSIPEMSGSNLVPEVTPPAPREIAGSCADGSTVAVIDCGVKESTIRYLAERFSRVWVLPATVTTAQVAELDPDGLLVSNGPGDPAAVTGVVDLLRELWTRQPIFGICLGHQLIAIAGGARTYKLKYGHRGINHPVRRLADGKVEITTQNHGFAVAQEGLSTTGFSVSHINLNDGSIEGIVHGSLPIWSVQFHPEASPGPHDSLYLFAEFERAVKKRASST